MKRETFFHLLVPNEYLVYISTYHKDVMLKEKQGKGFSLNNEFNNINYYNL